MESTTLEKTLDMAGNVAKLAANLTEKKDIHPPVGPVGDSDNSNNASTGSQNIQIHMDAGKKRDPKPVEKHIHEFPDNRPLTDMECDLALKKAQMEYELNKTKQEHYMRMDNLEWQHKLELEKKNERKEKVRRIIGGILIALGIGGVGYGIYSDYRDHKNQIVQPKPISDSTPIKADGEVK